MRDEKGRFKKGTGLNDLANKRYGRLTAIRLSEKRSGKKTYWECLCDCGNLKTVRTDSLKDGKTRSCGCLKREQDLVNLPNGQGVVKHGLSRERIYHIWRSMLTRCNDEKDSHFKHYGGRGIVVCEEWKDIEKFYEWAMANGYEDTLTIDRIDVNGNYEPKNCKWSTWKEQANNKRNNVVIEYGGVTKTLSQWSEYTKIPYDTLVGRMHRGVKPPQLFDRDNYIRKDNTLITHNGETKSITEWSKTTGIKAGTISERYRRGVELPRLLYKGNLANYNK